MEDLLREAFQLGQQWVQDTNNDKEPTNFNTWYRGEGTQKQLKNCSIPDFSDSVLNEIMIGEKEV